jgi:hypothetical protein
MRCTGHVTLVGEKRNAHNVLAGKLDRRRPLGRPRCRWEDNMKVEIK